MISMLLTAYITPQKQSKLDSINGFSVDVSQRLCMILVHH